MPEQSVLELSDIDLNLEERLSDPEFRREWFRAELEDAVPEAYRNLRIRRGITQAELARRMGTKQPAICRFEQSDEAVWQFDFLLRLAEAMDARLRVIVEAAEDVLGEYEEPILSEGAGSALADIKPLEQQPATSALGDAHGIGEYRGSKSGLSYVPQSDEGDPVFPQTSQRSDQSVQLSALSQSRAAAGVV